jgi:glucuronokinase
VAIPRPVFANLVLGVEKEELRISAGLQDRVAQAFQGLVYMDFNRELMARQGYGRYEELDAALLPPVYIAYRSALAETSDVYHHDLRSRYEQGDAQVLDAIAFWADLTEKVRAALLARTPAKIATLMNANFDRRAQLYQISPGNLQMVEAARSVGASAKFTGSGGAIIGTYEDEAMFQRLKQKLNRMDIEVIKPAITAPIGDGHI